MAAYIQVENQKVKRGNFYFVGEATGDDTLSDRFFDMEKHFYTNRARFSQGMRLALEKFVYSEYCRIYGTPYDATCSIKEAEDSINGKILEKTQSNLLISNIKSPIKAFLCLQCSAQDKLALYEDALRFWRKRNRYTFSDLKRAIFDCYEFACNEHHENPPGIESYDPNEANEENCTKWLQFLHAFLCAYCKNHFPDHTDFPVFDKDIIPIEEYVRVPRSVSKKLNVPQVATKALYVSGDMENIKYYWICDADQEQAPNREIDVLQKIWAEDNDIDPRNVIRLKEKFHVNETLTKLVFSFPSKPLRLSWSNLLETMTLQEREKIFVDAMRAISSLHDHYPPLYHRDITPDAFIICRAKNGYKLFLNAFDCVKDTDENVSYTMGAKVIENKAKDKKQPYIAPEILSLKENDIAWETVDWKKTDIYALGKLGVFIFTGSTDIPSLQQVEGLNERMLNKLIPMCAPVERRPSNI